ncbi:Pyridoxal-dependent decarboxylase, pyridoxal binding domain protein [Cooperia oncophora]
MGVMMMTLDSVEELRKIVSITKEAKNFGADETTSKLILHEAARIGAKIHGISFHIGSGVENCRPLALSLANARKLFDYGRILGHPISILDIGGGFMATTSQHFLKVGNFIENSISSCFEGVDIRVIAEPGRFLNTWLLKIFQPHTVFLSMTVYVSLHLSQFSAVPHDIKEKSKENHSC